MRARVFVTLKPSVFDPQGRTIVDALQSLGYDSVADVRQGKYFELDLATTERAQAERLDFKQLLLADPDVTRVLPAGEIERAFDLEEQLTHVDYIFDRVFQPVRA